MTVTSGICISNDELHYGGADGGVTKALWLMTNWVPKSPFVDCVSPSCDLCLDLSWTHWTIPRIFSLISYQKWPQHLGRSVNLFRSMIFYTMSPYGKSSNRKFNGKNFHILNNEASFSHVISFHQKKFSITHAGTQAGITQVLSLPEWDIWSSTWVHKCKKLLQI